MFCKECFRSNGHHPHCPEAEDAPEPTFTVWVVGRAIDDRIVGESAMRTAAKAWGFDPSIVVKHGEADIVNECGIVIGGCYSNDEEGLPYE